MIKLSAAVDRPVLPVAGTGTGGLRGEAALLARDTDGRRVRHLPFAAGNADYLARKINGVS